jgi:hypothetical protein
MMVMKYILKSEYYHIAAAIARILYIVMAINLNIRGSLSLMFFITAGLAHLFYGTHDKEMDKAMVVLYQHHGIDDILFVYNNINPATVQRALSINEINETIMGV